MTISALAFQNTRFDIIDRDGYPWLRSLQIAKALGYADDKSIHRIYNRHSSEFTNGMTGVVNLTTPSGLQDTRIFSLRGAHLLGMFARTSIAKEFRKWVLDVLDGLAGKARPLSGPLSDIQARAAYTAMSATVASLSLDETDAMIFVIDSIRVKFGANPPGISAARFDELIGFIGGLQVGAKASGSAAINDLFGKIGMRLVPVSKGGRHE